MSGERMIDDGTLRDKLRAYERWGGSSANINQFRIPAGLC